MNDWKKVSEHVAYEGWRKIIVKKMRMPDGKEADFDIIGNDPFVTVAAFTADKEAILVKQFRVGPEMMMTSFPEGYIDKGESYEDAARRELLEETGYEAGEVSLLKEFRSAYTTDHQICLLATDCKKVAKQELDSHEFIEVFTLPIPALREYMKDPKASPFSNIDVAYLAFDYMGLLTLK